MVITRVPELMVVIAIQLPLAIQLSLQQFPRSIYNALAAGAVAASRSIKEVFESGMFDKVVFIEGCAYCDVGVRESNFRTIQEKGDLRI